MTEQKKTRREMLEELLAKNPSDAFTLYGLALECVHSGDFTAAEGHFRALLESHPDYVPGYQMYAQNLVRHHREEEAKTVLTQGLEAAARAGNQHALSEMQGLLSELG
jgi:cytochrome c-type biogenesis protein CcmH/NrfG